MKAEYADKLIRFRRFWSWALFF